MSSVMSDGGIAIDSFCENDSHEHLAFASHRMLPVAHIRILVEGTREAVQEMYICEARLPM